MVTPEVLIYHSSSSNAQGPTASIQRQKEHYDNLAINYEQQGMMREAEVFSDIAEELAILQKQIFRKKSKKESIID